VKKVIAFHIAFVSAIGVLTYWHLDGGSPPWLKSAHIWFLSVLVGGLGGAVYCLRGVYLNACVRKNWDVAWEPWYYIRPFVSLICGGVSCLFLKAGLLVLESAPKQDASDLGFLALAFVAGLNVDKFVAKVEDVAQASWGIEKSRAGRQLPEHSAPQGLTPPAV
jgi:hypothetical protein